MSPVHLKFHHFDPALNNASFKQKSCYFLSTTFYTGHFPASGTWGALVAFLAHNLLFPNLFLLENWLPALVVIVVTFMLGMWMSSVVEDMTRQKDDSRVTVDEVVGYFIAVLFIPAGWVYTIPAFVLCRVFDIIKPFPANRLQRFTGGLGIMIDDVIASIYACVLMHLILYLI